MSLETPAHRAREISPPTDACQFMGALLDCETSSSDPMQFWRENQSRLPRLAVIAKQTFCAPRRTAAVERIFSIAGYILSQRRTRITDDNFQNQLFANVNSDLPEVPRKKLRLEK